MGMQNSAIREFYRNKSVLITGATGYVGRVLLQTILVKITEVPRVFCLHRSDLNGHPQDNPRVKWLRGDLEKPNWGLSDHDRRELQQEANVIFHLGAYTRWDRSVREQVVSNTLPVLTGADLAKACRHLDAYVFTSSY